MKDPLVSLYIVLNSLKSDFILRLPAENWSTRFEFIFEKLLNISEKKIFTKIYNEFDQTMNY